MIYFVDFYLTKESLLFSLGDIHTETDKMLVDIVIAVTFTVKVFSFTAEWSAVNTM